MGWESEHAIICNKCKMRSAPMELRKGTRIQNINIFNLLGFIDKHAHCEDLIIKQIASNIGDSYQRLRDEYKEYIEDIDISFNIKYEDKISELQDDLKSHRDRYNKVQELKKKLKLPKHPSTYIRDHLNENLYIMNRDEHVELLQEVIKEGKIYIKSYEPED